MIRKAVFSYFNPDESFGNTCGFEKYSDFLFTTALSIYCASRHFKEVQFFSSDWGLDVIKELGLPITSYSNKLNEMRPVSKYFWAYGKLLAYAEQDVPFVHIDNDVLLWKPLPNDILNANLCFQSQERFDIPGYKYYDMLRPCWDEAPARPKAIADNVVTDFAYNCGICGGHNLKFFKELRKCSAEYIFAPENFDLFFKKYRDIIIHQNLFHEQYFAAALIKKHHLRRKVVILHENAMQINDDCEPRKPRYTHLWGTIKRDNGMIAKLMVSLLYQNQALFNRVYKYCMKNGLLENVKIPLPLLSK